jgi:hypothetical protein
MQQVDDPAILTYMGHCRPCIVKRQLHADVLGLAERQKAEAETARAQVEKPGTYKPFLVSSELAASEDPKREFRSIAIIDHGQPTARVIRQFFKNRKKLDRRDVTVARDEVEHAMQIFEHLKRGAEVLT